MEFMPHNMPLVVLSFLFTGFLLAVMGVVFLYAWAAGKRSFARKVFVAALVVASTYGGALLVSSLRSSEKVLAAGQQKYFCEIDCHLVYSVTSVTTVKTLGSGPKQATAAGTFYVVTVKTWFDERTISSHRAKDMPLSPNRRVVRVLDDQGRSYRTSLEGLKALENASVVPLTQQLRPGDSYESVLVFDLPADVTNPRLLLANWGPISRFLIGHENSFLHKKIFFRLRPHGEVSRSD